ncbi:MAG: nucleotidyltransferase domain-containing protein [Clostridiales bacterium]|nr:nucleotidyltransferase domain-containing protein [Clostridiales bacterium]
MFEFLGRSKIRKKIILLFVYNQGKEFYLSEIARRMKTSVGTTQRELNRLVAIDFITFRKRGNLNIYRLNEKFALLAEIEAIVRKTFGIEAELGEELRKLKGVKFAFLFGSYVKGSFKSDSDIDLFIIGSPDEDDVYRVVQKVEDAVGREINYHLAGEKEFIEKSKKNSFFREILREPLMLVGKQNELQELIR